LDIYGNVNLFFRGPAEGFKNFRTYSQKVILVDEAVDGKFARGSTIASLQESHGKPPEAIVRQWGLKYLPDLETSEEEPSV
jgi:hypothetical protein